MEKWWEICNKLMEDNAVKICVRNDIKEVVGEN